MLTSSGCCPQEAVSDSNQAAFPRQFRREPAKPILRRDLRYLQDFRTCERYSQSGIVRSVIESFRRAEDRYLALRALRARCPVGVSREQLNLDILRAYVELKNHARAVAGLDQDEESGFAVDKPKFALVQRELIPRD
jgi:hypothetical protein